MARRIDIRKILGNPVLKRKLMVGVIRATQLREGIETSEADAERAYDMVNEK